MPQWIHSKFNAKNCSYQLRIYTINEINNNNDIVCLQITLTSPWPNTKYYRKVLIIKKQNLFFHWFDGPIILEISEGNNLTDTDVFLMIWVGSITSPKVGTLQGMNEERYKKEKKDFALVVSEQWLGTPKNVWCKNQPKKTSLTVWKNRGKMNENLKSWCKLTVRWMLHISTSICAKKQKRENVRNLQQNLTKKRFFKFASKCWSSVWFHDKTGFLLYKHAVL